MPKHFDVKDDGSLVLTNAGRALSTSELRSSLAEAGFEVSRTTAWRARKSGVCWPRYHERGARTAGDHLGWVGLTRRERQLGPSEIARRFGIDLSTARRAIQRGWFSITLSNQDKVTVARGRIRDSRPPADRPPVEPLVPELIRHAPDGRPIASLRPVEIVAIFGVSTSKAGAIRKRGEIRTRGWPLARRRALARALSAAVPELEDAVGGQGDMKDD